MNSTLKPNVKPISPAFSSEATLQVRSQEMLPPALRTPLDLEKQVYSRVSATASELLRRQLNPQDEVYYFARTDSKIDVGSWFVNRPIWVFALNDSLLCLSCPWTRIGPKPYVDRIGYPHLRQSLYNHITGSVVLAPAGEKTHCHLALAPTEAYQLLAQIYLEDRS